MPRKKFTLAPDAAARRIVCGHYSLNGGAPRCDALTHPWCLAPGEAPEICKFRIPPEPEKKAPPRSRKKPEAEHHAEAD